MESRALVSAVAGLEDEADALLAQAEDAVKTMRRRAQEELAAYREKLARDVAEREAAYQAKAASQHALDLAEAEKELQSGLAKIAGLSDSAVQGQVKRVVSRFREW